MVKQHRARRCFSSAAGNSVSLVRIPVVPVYRRHLQTQRVNGSATTEEERGEPGPDGGPGEMKRARLDGTEEAAALTNREKVSGSCDQPGSQSSSTADALRSRPSPDQKVEEPGDDSRAAEAVRSLKVTIQQSSESREFVQTHRTAALHCHVCLLTCRSPQLFQEHMMGSEHLRKLKAMTHSICLHTQTLHNRGRRPEAQRWCDTCQTPFSDDIILHRRTKQHKMCKQLCRPFCPVCKRHFRTPRKFVEHMKSSEHKEQVHLEEAQEEELITVDAVGCFEEEEEKKVEVDEEEEEEEAAVADEEDDDDVVGEEKKGDQETKGTNPAEGEVSVGHDPITSRGSRFVFPVSGFLCRLCNKFFYNETTARQTHCRTHTHCLELQRQGVLDS
ncbi:cdkn1a interacting zinc finger protein 1b isoform X2 [Pungitius pungitius]|uniref:cdkn1a interacting zinc finger protein 1b isoform X2 n=1 Tax=Pungitius pungitius TaxID=134920 RepID=UPI002E13C288